MFHTLLRYFLNKIKAIYDIFYSPTIHSNTETDEELMHSGQWRDPSTELIWMRCSLGQTWNEKEQCCTGERTRYNWNDAFTAIKALNRAGFGGHKDWRLPDFYELSSINQRSSVLKLDEHQDIQYFPDPIYDWYWSASPAAYENSFAWGVYFYKNGSNDGSNIKSNRYYVRAVRGKTRVKILE